MTVLSHNVEDMLKRLETHSASELNLVRALAEAIRQVDDQTLHELRNLSLQHELRRETILGELQLLAARMCQLPTRPLSNIKAAIGQPAMASQRALAEDAVEANAVPPTAEERAPHPVGGDWRRAAQNIEDDLDFAFGPPPSPAPRH